MLRVPSSDGVEVAVHDFGGPVDAPVVLVAHATGFHARCYEPFARALAGPMHPWALDFRGHGETPAPPDWSVDWLRFGDDALAATRAVAPHGGVVGVGHSMGGAALLMAAHRAPELFDRLVLFEPIVIPDTEPVVDMEQHPIVIGARRRRRTFTSVDDAVANYRTKPPLSLMREDVLRSYVEHGFRPGADGIELVCSESIEAGIFLTSHLNGVWELLPGITIPTTVVSGIIDERQPSGRCRAIADRLPDATFVLLEDQTHLGPFSHPETFAHLVLHPGHDGSEPGVRPRTAGSEPS